MLDQLARQMGECVGFRLVSARSRVGGAVVCGVARRRVWVGQVEVGGSGDRLGRRVDDRCHVGLVDGGDVRDVDGGDVGYVGFVGDHVGFVDGGDIGFVIWCGWYAGVAGGGW